MLLSLPDLVQKYDMLGSTGIHGVLHLGAHLGEEAPTYHDLGIEHVWWVEANPFVLDKLAAALQPYDGQQFIQACIANKDNLKRKFHVTNYDGLSSSLLEFGTHPEFSPDIRFERTIIVSTQTVDHIVRHYDIDANFLTMDLQGAELMALQGATMFLAAQVDYVFTEVNKAEVYKNCARVEELDAFLHDFERVETYWVPDQGWGDALYIRRARPSRYA